MGRRKERVIWQKSTFNNFVEFLRLPTSVYVCFCVRVEEENANVCVCVCLCVCVHPAAHN